MTSSTADCKEGFFSSFSAISVNSEQLVILVELMENNNDATLEELSEKARNSHRSRGRKKHNRKNHRSYFKSYPTKYSQLVDSLLLLYLMTMGITIAILNEL
jgi:ABC-type bacteriocin/lantibiotic exporter with double-glycine peptidase domain